MIVGMKLAYETRNDLFAEVLPLLDGSLVFFQRSERALRDDCCLSLMDVTDAFCYTDVLRDIYIYIIYIVLSENKESLTRHIGTSA